MDYNRVILTGRLTKDPDLRYTGSGKAVVQLSMAVNPAKRQEGNNREDVSYFDVVVFGKVAENCKEYLVKGRQVLVEGRLRQRRWTSQDGQQRRKVEIVANMVHFIGPGQKEAAPLQDEPDIHDDNQDEDDIPF